MNLLGVTLAVDASSVLHAFSICPDGNAWSTTQAAAGSDDWTVFTSSGQPAVPLIGPIAAATDGNGALQVFATGRDGNVYNLVAGGTAWTTLGAPSGLELGGLGVVADTSGRLWLFGLGSDGGLWWSWESGGIGTWSAWTSLGAPGAGLVPEGSLGVALDGDGDPLVCAVGLDGNMYAIVYDDQSTWGSWASIGAPSTAPLVGSAGAGYLLGQGGNGQVWAIAVGSDGNAWLSSQSSPGAAWSSWTCVGSAGGGFVGGGSLGALYAGQLCAAGVGGDGNLYLASCSSGAAWQPWQPLGSPLTVHEPLFTYSVAELGTAGTLDLGSSIGIALDGNSSFSIGVWLRLAGRPHKPSVLLQKGQELTVSLQGTQAITVELGSATSTQAPVDLQLGRWHYILVTFSPSGQSDNTGDLTIYLDGGQVGNPATLSGIASTSADFIAGGSLHAQLYNVSMWSACLTGADLVPLWTAPPAGPTLAASFWFTQSTAVDTSGNGNLVTPGNDAVIERLAPGLSLNGASYAQPGPHDPANPGNGGEPFSVTAWIHPLAPRLPPPSRTLEVVVLANGTAWGTAGLICSLEYDQAHHHFRWRVRRGGLSGTTVTAARKIAAGEWSHVAVTYDGSTLTLYVDGAAAGSAASGAIPALASPAVTIGAMPDATNVDELSGFFTGGIQAVGVWTECLTAAEVAVFATTDPTSLALPACAAFYRFGLSGAAQNTMTGISVGLFQSAALEDFVAVPPAAGPLAIPRLPRVRHRPPSLLDLLETSPPAREVRPASTLISPEGFDRMIASYGEILATVPKAQRAELADRFEQNLYRGVRLQEAAGGPTPGMVTHARDGGDIVFYYHAAAGADEVARVSAAAIDPCTAWIIDIIATAIGLLATVIGVGFSIAKVLQYLMRTAIKALVRATQVIVELDLAPTALPIRLARALYNVGLLGSAISEGLSGYSWWNWIFAAIGLALNIVALWVTGGWWLAFLVAQLAFVIGQLVYIVNHPPAGCQGGPRISVLSPGSAAAGGAA